MIPLRSLVLFEDIIFLRMLNSCTTASVAIGPLSLFYPSSFTAVKNLRAERESRILTYRDEKLPR